MPRFADRALMPTAGGLLLWSAAMLALYPWAAASLWTILPIVFAIGLGGALGTVLQTRLMDVAGEAQTLAATLNHSALNIANALGALLGGAVISAAQPASTRACDSGVRAKPPITRAAPSWCARSASTSRA